MIVKLSDTTVSSFIKANLDHERLQPIGRHVQSSLGGIHGVDAGNLATIPGLSRAMIQRAAKSGHVPFSVRVENLLKKNEVKSYTRCVAT